MNRKLPEPLQKEQSHYRKNKATTEEIQNATTEHADIHQGNHQLGNLPAFPSVDTRSLILIDLYVPTCRLQHSESSDFMHCTALH